MHNPFSIEEALKFGWEKTKLHSMVLFQVLLTLFALNVVSGMLRESLHNGFAGGVLSLATSAVGIVLGIGFLIITLKIAKGEAVAYRDILPPLELAWWVFLASLLAGVLTFAGLILLIIPGIYFALRFSMVRYAVIEGAGVMESFEKSTALTDGHKWQLLGLFVVFGLVNLIGLLLLGVGLLITVPITAIAAAHVYLKLKAHKGHSTHEHHGHEGHDLVGHSLE